MLKAHDELVNELAKPGHLISGTMTPRQAHLMHMAIGIAGEAGELLDVIKKHVIYNKDLDLEHLMEEMGDLMFYLNGLRMEIGATYEEILTANINKLRTRYPDKQYTDKHAQLRADKT